MLPLLTSLLLAQQSISAQLSPQKLLVSEHQDVALETQLSLSVPTVPESTTPDLQNTAAVKEPVIAGRSASVLNVNTASIELLEDEPVHPLAEADGATSPPDHLLAEADPKKKKTQSAVAPLPKRLPAALKELIYPQEVRSLPGSLDAVPVFNSNSPEVIRKSGILLSTFPSAGKRHPTAHLNFPFQGRFDIFSHHIVKTERPRETPTFYKGILLYNPSQSKTVTINVMQAASYLGTPDAPYVKLPPILPNDNGRVFSGPGGRLADHILRGRRQTHWPSNIQLKPRQSIMLASLPIPVPVRTTASNDPVWATPPQFVPEITAQTNPLKPVAAKPHFPSSNTRSTLARLYASGPVYVASLAMKAPTRPDGGEGIPSKKDWETLLLKGELLEPRDIVPSPLTSQAPKFFYGRVAGVSRGSQWRSQITDTPKSEQLTVPEPGDAFSYGLNTLHRGTFGTEQIQSAPMLTRYPDTAYLAHGNYGVHYDLALPLYNDSPEPRTVTVLLQTPLKDNEADKGLRFLKSPSPNVFFRGTVRVSYNDDDNHPQRQYFHVVQTAGHLGDALVTLTLQPQEKRLVKVDFVYPPDATPPQVLTVKASRTPKPFRSTQRP